MEALDRRRFLERTGRLAVMGGALGAVAAWEAGAARRPGDRHLRELARELRGSVVTSASAAYARARLPYNTRFDGAHPRAIVYCESTEDVERTVHWARRHEIRIVPRCGGHSYGGYSTTPHVLVDVTRIDHVRPKPGGQAVVGAGALLIDLYAQLAPHGLTVPAGTCPSVGIAGLTLGGGIGFSGRKLGLTCDNLLGAVVVTADGRARHCDATEHGDLFWACRGGGGGNFGIVTSFRFRAHPVDTVARYQIAWPWADAPAVVAAWQAFAPYAPDELFSTLFFATTAKAPGATPAITSGGQFFGTATELESLIAPLVAVGHPKRVTVTTLGYFDAAMQQARCGDGLAACHRADKSEGGTLPRLTFKAKSDYANVPLSMDAVRTLLAALESNQADAALAKAEVIFDAHGGVINRIPRNATAFVHRDSLFSIQYLANWNEGGDARPNLRWLRSLYAAMRPFVSGFAYQNYIDPELQNWEHAYYGSNFRRLVAIKKKYDRGRLFRFAQSIPTRV
jgi:FAD/FMN-containing dehydrogenase